MDDGDDNDERHSTHFFHCRIPILWQHTVRYNTQIVKCICPVRKLQLRDHVLSIVLCPPPYPPTSRCYYWVRQWNDGTDNNCQRGVQNQPTAQRLSSSSEALQKWTKEGRKEGRKKRNLARQIQRSWRWSVPIDPTTEGFWRCLIGSSQCSYWASFVCKKIQEQ